MSDVEIKVTENGPYAVKGPLTLLDPDGNAITYEGDRIWLCRCGGSTNKPFCDGTHSKIGFQGAIRAVEESGS